MPNAPNLAQSILAAALLAAAQPLSAQDIRGRVLDATNDGAISAAYVEVLLADRQVATVLSDAEGRFVVSGLAPGEYVVRADHIGYAPTEAVARVGPGGAGPLELSLDTRALQVDELTVSVDRECRLSQDDATRIQAVWAEVAKAFRASALAEEQSVYEFRYERWDRTLEPSRLLVEDEQRSTRRSFQRDSPFRSAPPEELAAQGYVRGDEETGYDYFAPDARTLASSSFQDAHCFGVIHDPPRDGEAHWVGIQFFPRPTDLTDVAGTLWVDGDGLTPERLDFTYTNLPWAIETEHVGGRVDFARTDGGVAIVQEWRIRMPLVERHLFRPFDSAPLRDRYQVTALTETGGRVTEMRTTGRAAATFAATGSVAGTLRDADGAPVDAGRVRIDGTSLSTTSNARGAFSFPALPEGRYGLSYSSPLFDSLGLAPRMDEVNVEPGRRAMLSLTLPSAVEAVMAQCREPLSDRGDGVLRGVLTPSDSLPESARANAVVRIRWASLDGVSTAGGQFSARQTTTVGEVPVADDGRWTACGVPSGIPVEVQAMVSGPTGTRQGPTRTTTVRSGGMEAVTLQAPTMDADVPVYALDPITVAVERARTRLLNDVGVRTNELGRRFMAYEDFREDLPRARDAADLIRIRNIPNVRVERLDAGTPCIYSTRYTRASAQGPTQLCAMLVINGITIPSGAAGGRLSILSADQIAAMAFLRPSEAGARFGTNSAGGVLFIWTHQGDTTPPGGH